VCVCVCVRERERERETSAEYESIVYIAAIIKGCNLFEVITLFNLLQCNNFYEEIGRGVISVGVRPLFFNCPYKRR